MKGYKVFNPDFTCKGMQFKENEIFEVPLPISICNKGIHFCQKAQDCFSYYSFNPENIVCEVEALGEVQTHANDSKVCTNKIQIGRQLTWQEVLVVANSGANNTGHSNSGNWNSGNWNSGDSNSGYRNSGNWNSGDSNSGYRNSGYSNSGDSNSGDSNSGNWNSGYRNSGDSNSGNWNSGDSNSGNWNSGDSNSGDSNSGNWNSGNWNSGDSNSGDRNSGYSNSGNWNSGDSNSGNWNSGNWNSGDSNSGYRNSGAFCTDNNPVVWLFDKPTNIKVRDWESSEAVQTMWNLLEPNIWIDKSNMTAEDKEKYPSYKTTGGFLKKKTMHEAWADMWGNLSENKRKLFLELPNFDREKFKSITGLDV